ncbi:MAG: tRNA pseudouridine(55) synthase TruB [Sphaerochaetaceae bacterium]|nr:tRNA pseudouridine(55) synthase TruB [Sphaerochaetaceae bacterium]MDC7246851.1 tRNA pseudouridine(55) synthase TruB [Sphaerochaetaceae bacterium]
MGNTSSILLIDKPSGITSFSVLSPVKRTIDRKVGHAGTLDKFAHGLVIALTGRFTKLNTLFSTLDKTYIATFEFGKQTDTLDPEGNIIAESDVPDLETLSAVIKDSFTGEIDQIPPVYSAVHVNGKRSYALARSNMEVTLESRKVTIYSLDIISWEKPYLTVKIHCSKGTYVRSLARDIALAAGSRGYVTQLERISIGPYSISDAVSVDDKESLSAMTARTRELLGVLPKTGIIEIADKARVPMMHGNLPKEEYIVSRKLSCGDEYALILDKEGTMLAVVTVDSIGKIGKSVAILKQENE